MSDETQAPPPDADSADNADAADTSSNETTGNEASGSSAGEDDGQDYIDRSTIDFDPDDGLLSGTAIDGDSDIPGPHERGDDN